MMVRTNDRSYPVIIRSVAMGPELKLPSPLVADRDEYLSQSTTSPTLPHPWNPLPSRNSFINPKRTIILLNTSVTLCFSASQS